MEELKERDRDSDPLGPSNRCRDFDTDCADIKDKVGCWLYDPAQGWCPYLSPGWSIKA